MSARANDNVAALREDRLDGAEAIASYIGCTARQVFHMRERNQSCPIRKLAGVGLYAFRSEIDAWMRDPATLVTAQRKAS